MGPLLYLMEENIAKAEKHMRQSEDSGNDFKRVKLTATKMIMLNSGLIRLPSVKEVDSSYCELS